MTALVQWIKNNIVMQLSNVSTEAQETYDDMAQAIK